MCIIRDYNGYYSRLLCVLLLLDRGPDVHVCMCIVRDAGATTVGIIRDYLFAVLMCMCVCVLHATQVHKRWFMLHWLVSEATGGCLLPQERKEYKDGKIRARKGVRFVAISVSGGACVCVAGAAGSPRSARNTRTGDIRVREGRHWSRIGSCSRKHARANLRAKGGLMTRSRATFTTGDVYYWSSLCLLTTHIPDATVTSHGHEPQI